MRSELLLNTAPLSRNCCFALAIPLWFATGVFSLNPASSAAAPSASPTNSAANSTTDAALPLKSGVSDISLDLIVHGKRDRAISNLTVNDLSVTDDGKPVKLENLRVATPSAASPTPVTLIFDKLDDAKNKNARGIAMKILKALPDRKLSLAVMSVDGRLHLVQQYTTNSALIERAIGTATDAPGTNLAAESAAAEKALTTPGAQTQSSSEREAARMTLTAIEASQRFVREEHGWGQETKFGLSGLMALAEAQRKIPGRKIVLYFTNGIEADTRGAEMIKTAGGALNRAGVSVYTIDMSTDTIDANQQLMVTMAMGGNQTTSRLNPIAAAGPTSAGDTTPGVTAQAQDNTRNLEFGDEDDGGTPIGKLAKDTGGGYIPARGNLAKPIHQMVEDITNFYVASYTPPIGDYDGRFRPVAVRSLRKDISIHTRAGYYAVPPGDSSGLRPFELPLLALLKQPQPSTEFALRSKILQMGTLPGGPTAELVVEVPISELELRRDPNAGLFTLHASLLAQIVNASGTVVEHFGQDLRQHGGLDTVENARAGAVTFQRHFVASPGSYTLEVAITDGNSGKSATQKTAFDIAPMPSGPSVSDLALVRRTDPLPANLANESDTTDPLRSTGGEILANISGTIPAGTKQLSLYFLIHPGPVSLGQPSVEMLLSRDGKTVGRAPLTFRQNGETAVPYFATVGAGSLRPGGYLATVRITQGGENFERSLPLQIGDGRASDAAPVAASSPAAADSPETPDIDPDASAELAPIIVTASTTAAAPPPEELDRIVEGARKRALSYATTLPNFLCVELTNRSIDASGNSHWKHKDSFSQLLTYRNQSESRRMIELNGQRTKTEPSDLKGAISHGEFGGILNAVFAPSAHAEFRWKETGAADGGTVHVLEYRVTAKNSNFGLTDNTNSMINAAFHGLISIDAATLGVRQVTLIADDLPKHFSIHASAIGVAYEYIGINGHDYLLPTRATVSLRQRKHEGVLNEMQFREYRRFGSHARMLPVTP